MQKKRIITRMLGALALLVTLAGVGGGAISGAILEGVPSQTVPVVSQATILSPMVLERLASGDPDQVIGVIVTTQGPATLADEAAARLASATVSRRYANLDGYAASIARRSVVNLALSPRVVRVSFDQQVVLHNDINYATVNADLAYQSAGLTGNGVTLAVLDSGIAPHQDIGSREVAEVEIIGHEKGFADYYGHGTHVAGIIAGNGSASSDSKSFRKFKGIAPQARLIGIRVLGANGTGQLSDVLAGIDWVLSNRSLYKIRVLNVSLGHAIEQTYLLDPLCQALERAWKAGIVVVVSAGNLGSLGYGTINSPGNDPYVITVGASNNYLSKTRSDDILTTYSSRGPTALDHFVKPDLLAPGNRTISLRATGSTLDKTYPGLRVKGAAFSSDPSKATQDSPYFELSGSSMATAVVSGMAALMIQAEPSLAPDTVKARLMKSAEKRLEYDIFSEGAGFADLDAALKIGGTATLPSLSPQAVWTVGGIVIQDTGTLWGDGATWGNGAIWGDNGLRGTSEIAADSAVWGDNRTSSATSIGPYGAIWGDNAPRR